MKKKKKLPKKFAKKAVPPPTKGSAFKSPHDEADDLKNLIDGMGSQNVGTGKFPGIMGKKPNPFAKKK